MPAHQKRAQDPIINGCRHLLRVETDLRTFGKAVNVLSC